MVEENVSPLGGMDDDEPKALIATAEGAECKVLENGLPTEPLKGVGKPTDETVKTCPVEMGVFTELPPGDCGV